MNLFSLGGIKTTNNEPLPPPTCLNLRHQQNVIHKLDNKKHRHLPSKGKQTSCTARKMENGKSESPGTMKLQSLQGEKMH